MEPCLCGFDDCRSCNPAGFDPAECCECRDVELAWKANDLGWIEFGGNCWICPKCAAKHPDVDFDIVHHVEDIYCAGCGAEITNWKMDESGWQIILEDYYCPDCIAELERAAADDEA